MAQGSKKAYTSKQKRKAEHIEDGYKKKGVSTKEAEKRAWATVNKQDGGGKAKSSSKTSSTKSRSSSTSAKPKRTAASASAARRKSSASSSRRKSA